MYYMGDYYQGDYYQGDPMLGGLLAMGVGWAGKKLLGRGVRATGKALVKRGVAALAKPTTAKVITAAATGAAIRGAVMPSATYAPPSMMVAPRVVPVPGGMGTIPPPGGYTVRPTGGLKGKVQRFLPGGATGFEYVKRRRMNVTNVRALRRAIRRATGFAKLARRVLTFTSPRAPKGKAIFKRRRK